MGRPERKKIIEEIEKHRNSKVLVYFVGDRPIIKAQISNDSIRSLYDHLQSLNKNKPVEKIDLYIYSLGGALTTPWPIVSILREYCKTLNVLIPYKAFSAATLIALGADKIVMSRKGELGPIDPQLSNIQQRGNPNTPPAQIALSTEDVTSYISFIKDKVGIKDQQALADLTKSLADSLTPTLLGQVNRIYSHIRIVATKMLSLASPSIDKTVIQKIVESLTEKIYIHGHSINRNEAKVMGMQVEKMDDKLENLCWDLFLDYEKEMKLNSPGNPLAYFTNESQDEYIEKGAILACIESVERYHKFSGPLILKKVRNVPPQMNLNLSIPIQLPPGIDLQNINPQSQQQLQQFQQNLATILNQQLSEQLRIQMPVMAVDVHVENMTWKKIN